MYSGSIMGLALSPHMVSRLQWPSVFYVFGFIGIFWFLAWEKNASSSPAVDNKISKEERDYITSQTIKQVGQTIILQSCLLLYGQYLSLHSLSWCTFQTAQAYILAAYRQNHSDGVRQLLVVSYVLVEHASFAS